MHEKMDEDDFLMNTATCLFFICYIPEFYANYKNKNANIYNVFEKIVMLGGTGFAFGYAVTIKNDALILNYGPLFALDTIALFMRGYYAYKNRHIDVTLHCKENSVGEHDDQIPHNPLHDIDIEL